MRAPSRGRRVNFRGEMATDTFRGMPVDPQRFVLGESENPLKPRRRSFSILLRVYPLKKATNLPEAEPMLCYLAV